MEFTISGELFGINVAKVREIMMTQEVKKVPNSHNVVEAKISGNPIETHVSCIVSDIEMPLMDEHRLTKLVKEDSVLKKIPIILFSSLISEEIHIKGKALGADEQITKPEIANLVIIIDRLTEQLC
jgi:two-component system chemotaxis response regulator CheV